MHEYRQQTASMLEEFFQKINPERGALVVLGMSSSEVSGGSIGKSPAPQIGLDIVTDIRTALQMRGIRLAVQCCEHLNRALVIEKADAIRYGYTQVFAVPHPSAGGSAATTAYSLFTQPVLVQSIAADAGIDIGVTMIAMHLRPVVVPVRCDCAIGGARVDFAFSRPPLIGGVRAKYE